MGEEKSSQAGNRMEVASESICRAFAKGWCGGLQNQIPDIGTQRMLRDVICRLVEIWHLLEERKNGCWAAMGRGRGKAG